VSSVVNDQPDSADAASASTADNAARTRRELAEMRRQQILAERSQERLAAKADAAPPIASTRSPMVVKPTAGPARWRLRHRYLLFSFVFVVFFPVVMSALYLWGKAADQYVSTVGFSVRREEVSSAMDLLGGLTGLSKSSSSDTDILYEFLRSQKLVADIQAKLDLRAIWSKPEADSIYRFDPAGSIEDLVDYWSKMVRVSYDSSTGLIEVKVLAFAPQDATMIASALLTESSEMINDLSAVAREDAIRYARDELQTAQTRLKSARETVTKFRTLHQLVDPSTDVLSQAGLVGSLQNQLAEAQIEVDLLSDSAQDSDPRMMQAKRKVQVIEARIAAERQKVGANPDDPGSEAYANLVGDYERIAVDREFGERSYLAALAAYDAAEADARRKSRYLAAHIMPTTAEVSRYPQRGVVLAMISMFLFLGWAVAALVVYSLKDRR
jgi:capsular polysaccharide transport system permease protein